MPRFDEKTADCRVLTFKDGLLSKMAHDLDIAVTRFSIDLDSKLLSVKAEFDPRSLRVRHAVRDGVPDPKALSEADKEKIASQIQAEVLETSQHERITFTSQTVQPRADGTFLISGELELHGTRRPISVETRLEAGQHVAELELSQPDFGIVPFKAMMGTLKVKPELRVRLSVPA
jgi:polyisoprenoid-binding protein YceI